MRHSLALDTDFSSVKSSTSHATSVHEILLVVLCRMIEVKVRNVPSRLFGWAATRLRSSAAEGEPGTEQREREE